MRGPPVARLVIMPVAVCLAASLVAGAAAGVHWSLPPPLVWFVIATGVCGLCVATLHRRTVLALPCAVIVFTSGGAHLADVARDQALDPSLRTVLNGEFGGFLVDTLGPEGRHPPVTTRGVLLEDAFADPPGARLRVHVTGLRLRGQWHAVDGGVDVTVGGTVSPRTIQDWRAGRTIVAPLTFRRPARYFNPGVPDFERDLALGGTSLFASVKSALLVEIESKGSWLEERSASVRASVRESAARHVAPRSSLSAAIVSAILIGDRTGLPDAVRERLQAAGVYHVLAISGGNIAILVGLILVTARCLGLAGRTASFVAAPLLLAYAQVVVAGPSVFRAVLMALAYLAAQLMDQRAPPWQAIAVAAALDMALNPLDVRNAGFLLTFGATIALVMAAPRLAGLRQLPAALRWPLSAVGASLATELMLLPLGATTFGRVTVIGILLNLVAIPMMTVVQAAGFALALGAVSARAADGAGWVAHLGASALIESTRLVEVLPWLSRHVPPPPLALSACFYAALVVALLRPRVRIIAAGVVAVLAALIASGAWLSARPDSPELRLTMFDVGQGEAIHVRWPGGRSMLIDTGGSPFGRGSFDIGARVLRPALWAQGVRTIDQLLVTHGDPDHIGGAGAILESFAPRQLFEGIPVPRNLPLARLHDVAALDGVTRRELRAGDAWRDGDLSVRVVNPLPPDWERPKVRNDDSVVLELRYGDVAILLTGDIGSEIERAILPNLSPAPVRVLKVAHHGSKTSSSSALVNAWRPQFALISCGRGNRFGHPAPEVVARLEHAGAHISRTDRDGAIVLTTDGRSVRVERSAP